MKTFHKTIKQIYLLKIGKKSWIEMYRRNTQFIDENINVIYNEWYTK